MDSKEKYASLIWRDAQEEIILLLDRYDYVFKEPI